MTPEGSFYWLGLDVGTTSSRALLVDSSGRVRRASSAPHHEMQMARPMWAEQDPDDWWRALARLRFRGVLREAGVLVLPLPALD